MLFELINPSDPYTFEAASIEVAGFVACMLSPGFGARCLEKDSDESTPILFGWDEWFESRGIDSDWVDAHRDGIADAFDSFLIGSTEQRVDIEEAMAAMTPEAREKYRAERQDRNRSSMNQIGEAAYEYAKQFRAKPSKQGAKVKARRPRSSKDAGG